MSEVDLPSPVAARVVEQRITAPDGTVTETRVIECVGVPILRAYDPERDSPMAGSGWRYVPPEPKRTELPAGRRRWFR